jgi:PAS domain S-box-containing protein
LEQLTSDEMKNGLLAANRKMEPYERLFKSLCKGLPEVNPEDNAREPMREELLQTIKRSQNEFDHALVERNNLYFSLFNSIRDAILVADTDRNIIDLNRAFTKMFGYTKEDLRDIKTVFVYENEKQYIKLGEALKNNLGETRDFLYTVNYRKKSGEVFPGETGVYYLQDQDGVTTGFIGLIRDVSERLNAELEKDRLIRELQAALEKVRILSGMVPICSHCKKIRDDKGYWGQLEAYISQHSEAKFSHGICPECAKKHFPDMDLYDD